MSTENYVTELRAYSVKEIAAIYGVCDKTVKKWMKPFDSIIGQKNGRYYTVAQVKVIFDKLGLPGIIKE
jgi:hypothetical protein